MKKVAIPKCRGLKSNTSDEKEEVSKRKGLKSKTFDKKRGNPKIHVA
jgi:hypothetical protein